MHFVHKYFDILCIFFSSFTKKILEYIHIHTYTQKKEHIIGKLIDSLFHKEYKIY